MPHSEKGWARLGTASSDKSQRLWDRKW